MAEDHTHHHGDDCAGQTRTLTDTDKQQILATVDHMLILIAQHQWHDVVDHGRVLARHYGPNGEWHIALLLAQYLAMAKAAPLDHVIRTIQDPDLNALLRALAADNHGHLTMGAERRSRHRVSAFANLIRVRNENAARVVWNDVYLHGTDDAHRRGFIAFLLIWCTRTLTTDTTKATVHQKIRANAALN